MQWTFMFIYIQYYIKVVTGAKLIFILLTAKLSRIFYYHYKIK